MNPTCDLPGAEVEGKAVLSALQEEFGEKDSLPRMEFKVLLREEATVESVLREVTKGQYDFIHYAGHGDFVPDQPERCGLKLHGGGILTSSRLERALGSISGAPTGASSVESHSPILVILNACLSANLLPWRARGEFGVSLAQAILRTGVGGFLGNRWEVGDWAAKEFAVRVISDLAREVPLGKAVRSGRRLLYEAKQRDWCNYVFYGSPDIKL